MKDSDLPNPDLVRHPRDEGEERTGEINGYAASERSKNKATAEWMNALKQPSMSNTDTDTANFRGRLNNRENVDSEEGNQRQMNYFDTQNNGYMKASYSDPRAAYYSWMPAGFGPMRFPALLYPHSFLGFAPTVAWMKTNDNASGQLSNIEKIDRWESSRKSAGSSVSSEISHVSEDATAFTDNLNYSAERTKDKVKWINSDDDEGLVLEEKEMVKRRQKENEKLQTQAFKSQAERSSVIQENISIQANPTVITHSHDATKSNEQELLTRPAKRGRASTRQIEKTDQYWDRRKKNNVSAKKSRDARRQREAVMNQRSAMLETENLRLRAELASMREENARLKQEVSNAKKV